ncbi:hypothetical protein L1I79_27400 [Strepomyces sp. STD 3.1]|nr:hypothetical protein [Streptomyces sp. STD 3.1]
MPRIQILPLPEGASDERPPFVLVFDQVSPDGPLLKDLRSGTERNIMLAQDTGAQAVLVFEDTIEIPANDVSAYTTPTTILRVEGDVDSGSAALDEIRRSLHHAETSRGQTG